MLIDFIILHYQALDETNNCINKIREKVSGDKRIIIVDNCSPNESGRKLGQQYSNSSDVQVILMEENLGFAKGNNIGFKEAKKDSPDFIVVMNNDVFIEQDDFTERIEKSYKNTQFAILGPDIYSTKIKGHQNPQQMNNCSIEELEQAKRRLEFKNKYRWLLRMKYMLPQRKKSGQGPELINKILEGVVLHGACYVFSKDFIRCHENCFFNETFMYYESYILHYLAQKEGMKIIYDPSIKVLHHEDVATNQRYGKKYQKSIFVNKCQLDSCNVFLQLIKSNRIVWE